MCFVSENMLMSGNLLKEILLCVEVNSFVCEQIARSSGKVSSVFHFQGCKMQESKREISYFKSDLRL